MSGHGYPLLYTLLVWWFGTGAILYLDGLPRRTFAWSLMGATVVLGTAFAGLVLTAGDATVPGAYVAFTCGVAVWGFLEIAFLMGFLTGPRAAPCPAGATGWRRFGYAVQACLYHELSIALGAAAVVAATWDGANQVGTWTFLALWGMRQSAKLNVFLGVLNLNEHFLPSHLGFLASFFRKRRMNPLFPLSVAVGAALLVALARAADAAAPGSFEEAGLTFVAAMLGLGLIEHLFLVLPVPFAALWDIYLRARGGASSPAAGDAPLPPASCPIPLWR